MRTNSARHSAGAGSEIVGGRSPFTRAGSRFIGAGSDVGGAGSQTRLKGSPGDRPVHVRETGFKRRLKVN